MALLYRVQRISRHVSRFSKVQVQDSVSLISSDIFQNSQARSLVTNGEPTMVLDEDRAFVCGNGKVVVVVVDVAIAPDCSLLSLDSRQSWCWL